MKILNVSHFIMNTWRLVIVLDGDARAVVTMNFKHFSNICFFLFNDCLMTAS
jgi:hypothetical protein